MAKNLRIAIYHNVPAGGAKRAIFEFAQGLAGRGHKIIEIVPSTSELDWCSLEPFVTARRIYPLRWPVWKKRVPFLTPYLQLLKSVRGAFQYHQLSREIARYIDNESLDVLFATDCTFMLTPPVAGHARSRLRERPSVPGMDRKEV